KLMTPSLRKRIASSRSRAARESLEEEEEDGCAACGWLTGDHRCRSWEFWPDTTRNSRHISVAKSVRASLTMYQNPWPACFSSGIFVVAMAVQMIMRRGITATRVKN